MDEMCDLTYKVEITISGNYPEESQRYVMVSCSGDGGLVHMIDVFKAALIAAGFETKIVKKLNKLYACDDE